MLLMSCCLCFWPFSTVQGRILWVLRSTSFKETGHWSKEPRERMLHEEKREKWPPAPIHGGGRADVWNVLSEYLYKE